MKCLLHRNMVKVKGREVPLICLLLACTGPSLAQRPAINPGGIVNGASFQTDPEKGIVLVPGGIASIFGRNLAATAATAAATPLPTELAGTSVTVGGVPAPLFYVSPEQINFQVPLEIGFGEIPVVVTSTEWSSDPVPANRAGSAPGAFTMDGSGCGRGVVLNYAPDRTVSLNTALNSASPGSYVAVWGTGAGDASFPPPDGHPAKVDPLSFFNGSGLLGFEGFEHFVTSPWSGRAPGLVGVDQFNLLIPEDAPEGCNVTLRLNGYFRVSQPVTLSIRREGGPCQDAPPSRIASLYWQRNVTVGDAPAPAVSDSFTASFVEAPEDQLIPRPSRPERYCGSPTLDEHIGPRCPGMGGRQLDAGPLLVEGLAGVPISGGPSLDSGEIRYAASLPAGSFVGRDVEVAGRGGAEIPPFRAKLALPEELGISTSLEPGTVISRTKPFRVEWKNDKLDAVVRVSLGETVGRTECSGLASDGGVTIELQPVQGIHLLPVPSSENASVLVIVTPRSGQKYRFSIPGLTREGTQEWRYVYRFNGLKLR